MLKITGTNNVFGTKLIQLSKLFTIAALIAFVWSDSIIPALTWSSLIVLTLILHVVTSKQTKLVFDKNYFKTFFE